MKRDVRNVLEMGASLVFFSQPISYSFLGYNLPLLWSLMPDGRLVTKDSLSFLIIGFLILGEFES